MPKIKLLTDENVSPRLVKAMRIKGFDIKDIKEEKLFGINDNRSFHGGSKISLLLPLLLEKLRREKYYGKSLKFCL